MQPTDEERADFAILVELAGFRTPDIIESLKLFNSGLIGDTASRTFASVEQMKDRVRGKPGAPSSEDELEQEAREMIEFAQSGYYQVRTYHCWAVGMAIQIAFKVAPLLAGREWLFVHRQSDKKSFVTSDAPVILSTVQPREPSFWEHWVRQF